MIHSHEKDAGTDVSIEKRNEMSCEVATEWQSERKTRSRTLRSFKEADNRLTCRYCKEMFVLSSELICHLEEHIDAMLSDCGSCATFFKRCENKKAKRRHKESKAPDDPVVVKLKVKEELADLSNDNTENDIPSNNNDSEDSDCGPRFEAKYQVFKCSQCELCFNRKYNFRRHMKTHESASRPFMCIKCGKCFGTNAHLNQHMITHMELKPFTCSVCGKGFKRKDHLEIHQLVHSDDKPHMCSICGKCYGQKSALNTHVKSVHQKLKADRNKDRENHICTICGKSFFDKNYIKSHILKIHLKERPFGCDECGRTFNEKSLLNIHLRTHSGLKPFKCGSCEECFATRRELNVHMVVHTGTKPFACEMCGKSFISKGDLKRHLRVHSGDKPYKCATCFKSFTQKCHLNSHVKSLHPGASVYSAVDRCTICAQYFSCKDELEWHIKCHDGSS